MWLDSQVCNFQITVVLLLFMVLVLIITMLFPGIAIFFPRNELVILSVRISYRLLLLFSSQVVSDSVTLWTAARQASLSLTTSRSLPKFMCIESVMPSNHFILWHPLFLLSILPSIRVFSNESAPHIRPKYSASASPFQWFVLLAYAMVIKHGKISAD